ncbi:MAG: acyl-[acyl-carrier-protein] thioesterase [Candidatus Coproplasma sp.]
MYCNIKNYSIRYTDVDFQDSLKLSALLSLMEESACDSADELGFGYSVLQPKNIGFVILNWHLELYRAIKLGEVLTVRTWPVKPRRLTVFRDFELYVGDEKVGVATSRWCVINLEDFKIIDPSCAFGENMTYNETRSVEVLNWKIPSVTTSECGYSKQVTYSDYDHYNHVNNTKYADFLLDVFSPEELKGKYISTVDVNYQTQCKYGETLDFYREDLNDCTLIEGKVDGVTRVQMRIVLK